MKTPTGIRMEARPRVGMNGRIVNMDELEAIEAEAATVNYTGGPELEDLRGEVARLQMALQDIHKATKSQKVRDIVEEALDNE